MRGLIILLMGFASLGLSAQVRVVDKDHPDMGIEALVKDRDSKALLASSDQNGYIVENSLFSGHRKIDISSRYPSSYFVKKIDPPYSGQVIELTSYKSVVALLSNASQLQKSNNPSVALAYSEVAARTALVNPEYAALMQSRSIKASIWPVFTALSHDEVIAALGADVAAELVSGDEEQSTNTVLAILGQETTDQVGVKFSRLISEYQKKNGLTDVKEGQLDYKTLRSFSELSSGELQVLRPGFRELEVSSLDLPIIEGLN